MSIASYTDLVQAVANWLARDDLEAQVPNYIALAEAKFNRTLKCQQMERRSYTTIDTTSQDWQYVSLPADYQSMRSVCLVSLDEKPRLQFLDQDQIKDYRSNIGDTTSIPRYFGIFGTEMELVPVPAGDYKVEMVYRALIPALSAGNPTNWLLALAPDAYLYGVLLEASVYMKNDARIPVWIAGLTNAIDGLNGLDPARKDA